MAYQPGLQEGTDITGASLPSGGASGRGWLSAIWKALTDRLPAALTGSGNLKVALVESTASQTVAGTVAATQSGTWTVQPGNTANTTPWKVDASGQTQPVSAASLPLPTGAATEATLAGRLPAALSGAGNFKIAIAESTVGASTVSLTGTDGIQTTRQIGSQIAAAVFDDQVRLLLEEILIEIQALRAEKGIV